MTPLPSTGPSPAAQAQSEQSPAPVVFIHEDLTAMLPDGTGPIDLGCSLGVMKVWTGLAEGDDQRYVTGWVYLLQIGTTTEEIPEHIFGVIMYKLKAAGLIP